MKKFMKNIIQKHGEKLCMIAMVVAPIAWNTCRTAFYESTEPEGLAEFAQQHLPDKAKRQKA